MMRQKINRIFTLIVDHVFQGVLVALETILHMGPMLLVMDVVPHKLPMRE